MSAFRVGQKVVCIQREAWTGPTGQKPQFGVVYTVSGTEARWNGDEGLILAELAQDDVFMANKFRPVAYPSQSLEHDVGLFQRGHVPVKERA